jgi:hypothetical protein
MSTPSATPPDDPTRPGLAPGDEAPAGTPGTGENLCPDCAGSGLKDGAECVMCAGSGTVVEGIGGA